MNGRMIFELIIGIMLFASSIIIYYLAQQLKKNNRNFPHVK